MAESGHVPVLGSGRHHKLLGEALLLHDERVVPRHGEGGRQASEEAAAVVVDGPHGPVDELSRPTNPGPEGAAEGLMAEAHPQDGGSVMASGGQAEDLLAAPCRARLTGPGTHEDARRPHDVVGAGGTAVQDLDLCAQGLEGLDEVVGERIAIVDEGDHRPVVPRGGEGLSFRAMNIVIIGAGEVGQHLAGVLSREEHSVTVVDPDPSKSRKLTESLDVQSLVGDGTRADTLTDAGASAADLVIAVSDDDRVNMLTSVIAKKLGASRVIIRLKDTRVLADYRYFYKDALGFDVVLSTEELVAEELLGLVRERHALEVQSFANGQVQLRRLRLKEDSELTRKPLGELKIPSGVLVTAVSRGGQLTVPSGSDELLGKDQVYVLGSSKDLDQFERLAGEKVEWKRSVVIMGAGGIGREIALRLSGEPGISVLVLEQDPARARALDLECSGDLTVMVGDATDMMLFREERLADASVFVATTHDDEDNIVACQLAKSFGVQRTVALVEKSSYAEIFDLLEGVDQAISPRMMCAKAITRLARAGSPRAIAAIGNGQAEIIELEVGLKEPVKLRKLGLPGGVVLGALVRDNAVTIPGGETLVRRGDTAVVFAMREALEEAERALGVL